MSKYVIDTTLDNVKKVIAMGVTKGGAIWTDTTDIENLEELNSDYINEHFGDLQDTAYHRGLEEGSLDVKQRVEGAYQRGLEDAWECARKLFSSMADSDIEKAFPIEWNNGGFRALINLQPQEAIEKLKAYEEKQSADDKIEVGDEVADKYGNKTIVTNIHGDLFDGLCSDGSTMADLFLDDTRKTGRHFDIPKILEDMRHD